MAKKIKVIQKEGEKEIGPEIIAQSIVEISKAMRRINNSRLTRDAIVTLIARKSGVGRENIDVVMNNLTDLENTWLKPLKKK